MISDVLSEAVEDIKRYQRHMPDIYANNERLKRLVAEMDAVRALLDTPPEKLEA